MCDPVTMAIGAAATKVSALGSPVLLGATIALQAGSAFMGYQADKAKYEATKQYNDSARDAAVQAYQTDLALISMRQDQEGEKAAGELFQNRIDAAEARGAATATLGNVQGLSVGSMLGDLQAQEGRFATAVRRNETATQNQLEHEKLSAHSKAAQRVASLNPAVAPSMFSSGLSFAGSALGSIVSVGRYDGNSLNEVD